MLLRLPKGATTAPGEWSPCAYWLNTPRTRVPSWAAPIRSSACAAVTLNQVVASAEINNVYPLLAESARGWTGQIGHERRAPVGICIPMTAASTCLVHPECIYSGIPKRPLPEGEPSYAPRAPSARISRRVHHQCPGYRTAAPGLPHGHEAVAPGDHQAPDRRGDVGRGDGAGG